MTEIKSCITCKHCVNPDSIYRTFVWCGKFTYDTTDYVRGEVTTCNGNCEKLRKSDGKCGPDAIGWEQRPYEKPKSKMRKFLDLLNALKDF